MLKISYLEDTIFFHTVQKNILSIRIFMESQFLTLRMSIMALIPWIWKNFLPFLLVLLLIFLPLYFLALELRKKSLNLPPSPPKLPIIGNLHQLGKMPHLSLLQLSRKYGPIIHLQLGEVPTVVVSSARTAKEVLKTHDLALSSRPQIYSAKHLFYDCTNVVFSPYGAYWRHIRKICILELLSVKRVQSYRFIREEEVARLVSRIAESYPSPIDLTKMLGLYANDVLCRVVLGRDYSQGGDYDRFGFQKMLEDYQVLLGGFNLGDFFPSLEFIYTLNGMKLKLQSTFKRFDQFFDEVLKEHLHPSEDKGVFKDLIDILLEIQKNEDTELPLTMDNIKAIMLVSGPSFSCTQLHYMKAIIKEIFRLHPPVPVLVPRESMEDVTINGYDIPFGGGRRGCPAIVFGTSVVELALAQLLHSFDWELPSGMQANDLDMTEVFGISMHRKAHLIVLAKPHFS